MREDTEAGVQSDLSDFGMGGEGPRLHSLGGAPATPDMRDAWRCLQSLPEEALARLWELLPLALDKGPGPEFREASATFCESHGCDPARLARATSIAVFLLRAASGRDLPAALLEEDVQALSAGDEAGKGILLGGYERARQALRQRARRDTLFDHGRVVTDAHWRVERVLSSSRAETIDADLVSLTLEYRDGARQGRASFHLTPEAVQRLRAFCDAVLAPDAATGHPSRSED